MSARSQALVPLRKSECGQRAGIWAMMCPALEAFCLMT